MPKLLGTAAEREEWMALADTNTLHLLPKSALVATIKSLAERLLGLEPLEEQPEMHVDPKAEQPPLGALPPEPPKKFGIASTNFLTPNQGGDRVTRLSDGLPI